jgi:hypothetical protein
LLRTLQRGSEYDRVAAALESTHNVFALQHDAPFLTKLGAFAKITVLRTTQRLDKWQ